jgi:hypothetical protein
MDERVWPGWCFYAKIVSEIKSAKGKRHFNLENALMQPINTSGQFV